MNISNEMIDFLKLSSKLSDSVILLTDLNKFIFCSDSNYDYIDKNISTDLLSIMEQPNLAFLNNTSSIINLTDNDSNYYKSQIILSIQTDNYKGSLIFFNTNREYIKSNMDFAKTTKHFIEILLK